MKAIVQDKYGSSDEVLKLRILDFSSNSMSGRGF